MGCPAICLDVHSYPDTQPCLLDQDRVGQVGGLASNIIVLECPQIYLYFVGKDPDTPL